MPRRRVLKINSDDYELFVRLCGRRSLDECFHLMLQVFEIMQREYESGGIEGWLKEKLGLCKFAVYVGEHGGRIALAPPERYGLDLSKLPPTVMMKVYTESGECYYVVFPEDLKVEKVNKP